MAELVSQCVVDGGLPEPVPQRLQHRWDDPLVGVGEFDRTLLSQQKEARPACHVRARKPS